MPTDRWEPTPGLLQPGEECDRLVAEAHGISRPVVTRWRKRNGVAAGGKMGRPVGIHWEPRPDRLQPGEASDEAVARDQSISKNTVFRWRHRRK